MKFKHIRNQFTLYYVLLICLSVLLFEALIIGYSGRFFYDQVGVQLKGELVPLTQMLQKSLQNQSLPAALGTNSDLFAKNTDYEVQVYDEQGQMLIYTYGEWDKNGVVSSDVQAALSGQQQRWQGRLSDGRKMMTLSYPLMQNGQIKGVVRLLAPLAEVDRQIQRMALYFVAMGLVVIAVTSVGAYKLADTVTTPILNLIRVTRRMSTGDFSVKAVPAFEDEIGELAEGINHLASEIKKRDYLKNRMFSSVSHELRTPLTAIRGWAETLNDPMYTKGSEELEDGLGVIVSESDRLQQMVEELLDFSRMMSIELSYMFEEEDWVSLIYSALNTMKPKANQKQITLEAVELPELLVAKLDAHRIKQLLINLFDNALKFTPEGGVVTVRLKSEAEHISLIIQDTGCGIAEDELPYVKERFYKGSHAGSNLGIGLAICEEIVKAHGGVWDIKSALGKGTSIEMTFPRA